MDTQTLALLGVFVGALAASSALVNALVAIVGTWRDSRALTIAVEVKHVGKDAILWTLKVWNRARTPNALAALELFVNGNRMSERPGVFSRSEDPLIGRSLGAFSYTQVDLVAADDQEVPHSVWEARDTIEIRVHPVRGRRRRFKFRKADLVPAE